TLIDTHTGRTDDPLGFFLYNAEPDDLLFPLYGPTKDFYDKLLGQKIGLEFEGSAYLGLHNVILLLFILLLSLGAAFSRKARIRITQIFQPTDLRIYLLIAFGLLLFAFGMPFKLYQPSLDYFPLFKQFRATGRFSWVFYYVFSVFAAILIYRFTQSPTPRKTKIGIQILFTAAIGISVYEAHVFHLFGRSIRSFPENVFKKDTSNDLLGASASNQYQAIVSLPFFHTGSEVFALKGSERALAPVLGLSLDSGLPLLNCALPRVSATEAKALIKLMGPSFYPKQDLRNHFPNQKDFLLCKNEGDELNEYQERLWQKGQLLGTWENLEIKKIEFPQIFRDEARNIIQEKEHLIVSDIDSPNDHPKVLVYKSFDDSNSLLKFRGNGAYEGQKAGLNILFEAPPLTFSTAKTYEFSIWFYHEEKGALNDWFRCIVSEYDIQSNQYFEGTFFPEFQPVLRKGWTLVTGRFTVQNSSNTIKLITKGKRFNKAAMHADELLIKEFGEDVIFPVDSTHYFYNNHIIEIDSSEVTSGNPKSVKK
ncbi:MAG: hypothetical protein ACPF8V_07300, partial [Luteibaculum sp.]